jgi:hypothetical protein
LNSVYKSGYLEFHFLALVYTSAKFIGIEWAKFSKILEKNHRNPEEIQLP